MKGETLECWGRPEEAHPNVEMDEQNSADDWTDYVCPRCGSLTRVRA